VSLKRNVVNPSSCPKKAGQPQGELWGWRAWEGGRSECRFVMRWIGLDIFQKYPMRKHADFHPVFHHERICRNGKSGKAIREPK
jgi:hypothetical protein